MFLIKLKTFPLVLLAIALIGIALVGTAAGSWFFRATAKAAPADAKDAERPAKSVTFRERGFDDTADILNIVRHSGEVILSPGRLPSAYLAIDVYIDGQKQQRTIEGSHTNWSQNVNVQGKPIDFCIQIADLDYLPLGDGKKGHSRVLLNWIPRGGGSDGFAQDVAKEFFDFSRHGQVGYFSAKESFGNEIPLFYILLTDANRTWGASTIADVIRLNPKAKVAIVCLRLEDRR
jgi:hypothetical protein